MPVSAPASAEPLEPGAFEASLVSEALWSTWRETVERHGMQTERLGRLASSLQSLPTVIWHTPLGAYVPYTLGEIRQLKTHGEKRVRVVLEIFHTVHKMLSGAATSENLSVRLLPKFIGPIDEWIGQMMERTTPPTAEEIRAGLTVPLLDQIKIDAGDDIHTLAVNRLGIDGPPESVRNQARRLEITRARVYQLLDECANVMGVRWPEGARRLAGLVARAEAEGMSGDDLRLLRATAELFYPGKNRLADEEGHEEHDTAVTSVDGGLI
jgi:hypothetical protein